MRASSAVVVDIVITANQCECQYRTRIESKEMSIRYNVIQSLSFVMSVVLSQRVWKSLGSSAGGEVTRNLR